MTMEGSNWRDRFEQPRQPAHPVAGMPPEAQAHPPNDDDGLELDPQEYSPWVLQRGRSRPALMLHLRRYEPKAGLWMGWQLSYPHLIAVEYVGDRSLSLDFGKRQFVIEGKGLIELARRIQDGSVVAIQEYAASVWPERSGEAVVTGIKRPICNNSPRNFG
jgi:hypothetical protein